MTFYSLTEHIVHYIVKDHKHSTWNLKYLHEQTPVDKQGEKHYIIRYTEPKRTFRIKICKNNIRFHNVQNIPGVISKGRQGRILGPCIRFARHHGKYHSYSNKTWKRMQNEKKYANYDIQQFDHTAKPKSKKVYNKPRISLHTAILNMYNSPKKYLGRNFIGNEYVSLVKFMTGKDSMDMEDYEKLGHLVHIYQKYNHIRVYTLLN